jgi:hypothetical protein
VIYCPALIGVIFHASFRMEETGFEGPILETPVLKKLRLFLEKRV